MHRRVYKNTIILAALRVLNPALSMALVAFISRTKGPEFLGAYAVIITIAGVFGAVGELGIQTLITREVAGAKARASVYLPSALIIALATSVVIAAGLNLSIGFFGYPEDVSLSLRVMTFYIFLCVITGFFEAFFMAFERMGLIFAEQVLSNISKLVGCLIVIQLGYGFVHFVLVIVLAGVVAVAACFYMFRRYVAEIRLRVDWPTTWFLIRSSPVFLMTTLFGVVLSMRIDIIMLSKLADLVQVALYTAAYKVFETTLILPQSFVQSFFPELSRLYVADIEGFKEMMSKVFRSSLFYVVVITSVAYVLAAISIHILYGSKFDGAITPLKLLLFGLVPWSIAKVSGQILIASGRQRLDMISTIAATTSNVLLNVVLIPRYGASGAAWASTISLTVFCVPQLWFARTMLRGISAVRLLRVPVIVSAVVVAVIMTVRLNWLLVFPGVALASWPAFVYLRKKQGLQGLRQILKEAVSRR